MNGGDPPTPVAVSPIEDFFYLLNNVVLGESTIEDFILLVGTTVAFIAFILWCCFPVQAKDPSQGYERSTRDREKYNQLVMEYNVADT